MALTDRVHIYKLTDAAIKRGVVKVAANGETFEPAKNGVIKVRHPGVPHHETHGLIYLGYEGDGNKAILDEDLMKKHTAVANAELELRKAQDLQAQAEKDVRASGGDPAKLRKANDDLAAARALVATQTAAVQAAKDALTK